MDYKLDDLIDINLLQDLQEKLDVIYSVPSGIVDNEGRILTAVAWQDVCTKFHRQNPQCLKECIKSDQYIITHLKDTKPPVSYKCVHGLIDSVTPIIINGKHLANFFTGQFFLEEPDMEFFKRQAALYNFDEESYLEAVKKVPVWTSEKLDRYHDFIKGFVEWIARAGLNHLKEIEANQKSEDLLRQTLLQKEEIERNNKRLESLLRISQYKSKSKQDLLDYALKEAIYLSNSKIGYIYYYNEAAQEFILNTWSSEVKDQCSVKSSQSVQKLDKTGCWGEAVRQRKPFIINNFVDANSFCIGTPEGHVKMHNFLTIPVFFDDSIVAVVGLANKPEDFNYSDVQQLTLLMDVVWKMLDRVEMTENLRLSKEKAEESERLKSAFLANMSHEIRTPMNGILGFSELLKEPNISGEEKEEYIRIIEKSGRRMLSIINDIISISKLESGLMQVSLKETNINDQINYIYTFFKPEAEKKGIRIFQTHGLPEEEAIIKTDREKLYAILTNLVKNAIKFTWNGTINIGYNRLGNFLEFYVKDTGNGISPEHLEIVFERFRQGSESLTRNYEGAGLGLSISRAYVELLGGKIWVQSQIGKGSEFHFTIPYNYEPVTDQNESLGTEEDKRGELKPDLKILIVEDDNLSEFLLRKTVNSFARQILRARTGKEAVNAVLENPDVDLILMDIKMPEMDGYQATKKIREINKEVIIIVQTAFALLSDKEKALEAGCDDYLPKPVNAALLKQMIQKYFSRTAVRKMNTESMDNISIPN